MKDVEIINDLFNGQASIKHSVSERFADDIKDAIAELTVNYEDVTLVLADMDGMERHIEKLEAMLDRRKVRHKKWEDD